MNFKVQVDDNFHYTDETERYTEGVYKEYWVAKKKCIDIVDEFLQSHYEPGMTAEKLYETYTMFGEDPFITPSVPTEHPFSAWDFAKIRSRELCGEKIDPMEYSLDKHPS